MRRLGALLQKELWDHGLVMAGVAASLAVVWALLLLGVTVGPRTITVLEAHATFVRIFLPLLGLALGHRLIVREYHGRTQRFLEALPLRRGELIGVKLALGLAFLSAAAVASLAITGAVAAIREPVDARWIAAIAVRTLAFTAALWSFFFAMGTLGRWRVPLYLALFVGAVVIDQSTDIELERFGPLALVNETLVLERRALPWADLGVSAAFTLGLVLSGLALAILREGSVVESMAKAMSRREKAAIGLAFVAALVILDVADPRRTEAPFSLEGDEVARREEAGVAVLFLEPRHADAGEALADALAADRVALIEALGFEGPLPPLHVALRAVLEPHDFERVELDDAEDGVLLRAPFAHERFDADAFRAFALARTLDAATDGRAAFEPNAWVRDATAGWIATRGGMSPREVALARFVARAEPPSPEVLSRWQRVEERFGERAARAYAASAAHALVAEGSAAEGGEARFVAFARTVLEREPPWGMAAVIGARREPVVERLRAETGLDAGAFAARWRSWLDDRDAPIAAPPVEGWLRVEVDEGELRVVRWGVEGALDEGATCALLHAPLGPFDRPVAADALAREEQACAALGADGAALVGRYGPGERALFAIEVLADPLGVPLRVLATRREIP